MFDGGNLVGVGFELVDAAGGSVVVEGVLEGVVAGAGEATGGWAAAVVGAGVGGWAKDDDRACSVVGTSELRVSVTAAVAPTAQMAMIAATTTILRPAHDRRGGGA